MSLFDRFAAAASTWVSRAPFFVGCVLLVVLWLPSYWLMGDINTWQLIINTITTVVTFLLVALLQNSQERFEKATNQKLNAVADFLAYYATAQCGDDADMARHAQTLRTAVGIEEQLSA